MSPHSESRGVPIVKEIIALETAHRADRNHRYFAYGIYVQSEIPLPLAEAPESGPTGINVRRVPPDFFRALTDRVMLHRSPLSDFHYAHLPDGSSYVRWDKLGEFLVSADGGSITCSSSREAPAESFTTYLLNQALAFSLVKKGFEPLHATAVEFDGQGVAFIGNSGYGKSSLAASFLQAGGKILTDDLLLLRDGPKGIEAYPGPPRIKLFPSIAKELLEVYTDGVPMNVLTRKLVIPLGPERACNKSTPLRTIYSVVSPREARLSEHIHIERLSPAQAFLELARATFNYVILDAGRVQRHFVETAHLVNRVVVKKLSYPRRVASLDSVRRALVSDCGAEAVEVSPCAE